MDDQDTVDRLGHQAARDAELRRLQYTGVELDLVTQDYSVWDRGHFCGYARTPEAGRRLLAGVR